VRSAARLLLAVAVGAPAAVAPVWTWQPRRRWLRLTVPAVWIALGLGMMGIIRVRTTHEHIRPCLKQFAEMPQITEVHRLTGEDCFILKVVVPSPAQLESIVDAVARHGSVTTALVLRSETPKPIGRDLIRQSAR